MTNLTGKQFVSKQLDLFSSEYVSKKPGDMSNTMEVWDSIPKFFLSPQRQRIMRSNNADMSTYTRDFSIMGVECEVTLYSATIHDKNGRALSVFPSAKEEFVEEALKKLATNRVNGFNLKDRTDVSTWVVFSYRELQSVLTGMGHTLSVDQIKSALEILRLSQIRIKPKTNGEGPIRKDYFNYLPEASLIDRDDYEYGENAKNRVKLPQHITDAVLSGNFRQFNFKFYGTLSNGLARWIYKRLIHTWKNARCNDKFAALSPDKRGTLYDIQLSELSISSGFLDQALLKNRRKYLVKALSDLKDKGVLEDFDVFQVVDNEEGKACDYIFRIHPSARFCKEQIDANANAKKLRKKMNV